MNTNEQHTLLNDLVGKGIISQDQALLLHHQLKVDEPIFTQIQKIFSLDEWVLAAFEAERKGLLFKRWEIADIEVAFLARVPKLDMKRFSFLPLKAENDVLFVAFSTEDTLAFRECVKRYFSEHQKIQYYYAPHRFVEQGWGLLEKDAKILVKHLNCLDGWSNGNFAVSDVATEELLDFFLNEAYKLRASDIHFEPEDTNVRIRLRIDGYLQVYKIMSKQHWEYLSARIKVCAGMNSAEKRKPQSGRFSDRICGVELDIRVGSHPTINGESIVLRLLDKHKVVVPLDSLGFDAHSLNLLRQIYSHPQGLVLFTGPTGSGKTTTLYSILNQLNSGNINIMTLEDPVEYELKGVRQTAVQEGVLSFKEGIRAMLRQDPDVILIGEIRDEDTAKMCFRASQTGHLVFSTLHTNNVFGVFPRLMDFGISFESIKQTLVGVASQRLVRKVCVKCKGVGCKSCKETGLLGRAAIGEFLLLTNEVRSKLSSANLYNICDDLSGDVYISLEESANQAVSLGMTTEAEIIKYSGA